MSRKVFIYYGLGEGRAVGQKLIRALKQSGYTLCASVEEAEIIIAHSGGCFLVPPETKARVLLVNLPYYPGRSLAMSIFLEVKMDFFQSLHEHRIINFTKKTLWNLIYYTRIKHNLAMYSGRRQANMWNIAYVILIHNQDDPFCISEIESLPFRHKYQKIIIPGQHDDLWDNPQPYIDLL